MRLSIPENLGGELRLFEGPCQVVLDSLILGKSKANQPKLTCKYVITDDSELVITDENGPAVGETILETFSLQPQALFKFNELYKQATGQKLPHGDFDLKEFTEMMNEELKGTEWVLVLELQLPSDGSSDESRTTVVSRTKL